MSSVALISRITVHPGKRDELLGLIAEVLEEVAQQPGTLAFNGHAEGDDVVWMYELYSDQQAYEAHRAGTVFQAVQPRIRPLLAGAPQTQVLPTVLGPYPPLGT